jgi:hypothetical protein
MGVEHPSPFENRWRSRWIWFERPAIRLATLTRPERAVEGDRVGLFRRRFELSSVPATAPCRIWTDGRHVVRVNGAEVARGPVRANPRRAHYDAFDLAPHLRVGANVVTITAVHFEQQTSWWTPVPPSYTLGAGSLAVEAWLGDGMLVGADGSGPDGDDAGWLVGDAAWRTLPGDAWTPLPMPGDVACLPLESFDARALPAGWEDADFDDAGWAPAVEILPVHTGTHGDPHPPSEPFGLLLPPVRSGAGAGPPVRHDATLVARLPLPAVVAADGVTVSDDEHTELDPVDQVLADEQRAGFLAGAEHGSDQFRDLPSPTAGEILRFDLGHVAAGTVVLDFDGAAPGTVVDLAAADQVDGHGRLGPIGQHSGLRYVCRGGGAERFESLDVIGARHLHLSVRPPADGPGAAPTVAVAILERLRPRPEGAAFACSDPALEHIHAIGLRTVDLCAHDAYVDCPTREQRAWTGDSVVHQMVDFAANPDWSLARWHPVLAASPRSDGLVPMTAAADFTYEDRTILPDWSLHWVRSVHNLWRSTGDRATVAELLPVAERTLRWFEPYQGADGLLDGVTGWTLIDWASLYSSGRSSALNALWARALEDLAALADWVGNAATADWARARYGEVAAAFDAFWDDDRGVYVDHVVDGEQAPVAAQHGGAAALAAGIVPAGRAERVLTRLTDRSRLLRHSWVMDTATIERGNDGGAYLAFGYPEPDWDVHEQMVECEPFFRYVLHDGIARAGRTDLIAGLCRDWQVFVDAGETSWPENWNGGTRCHGWSSTPTRDLIVHVLGITPAEPGYDAVRVAPALGGLDWARATVPTPHGFVTVEAHADGTVEVDSPVPVVRG